MKPSARARIMIVDDHPIVRYGVAQLLNAQPDLQVTAEAEDAESALRQLRDGAFNLLIVDISLPGPSGLELIRRVKARNARLPVLVLSMHDESVYAERALAAGARGYLMKHEATDELVGAVRKVLAGDIHLSRAMQQRLVQPDVTGQAGHEPLRRLTGRELEVLQLIAQGFTSAQIAKRINRSVKSVEAYRTAIRAKLGAKSTLDLARLALAYFPSGRR